jgi:UDP-N-acetylglucosamine 2-epimerase (non-hydrolysing)
MLLDALFFTALAYRYSGYVMKILSIFGTRPEAIKMAPIVKGLEQLTEIESRVCVTGQHRQMLDQMLGFFNINADYDLNLMQPNQTLTSITANTITRLEPILAEFQPDWIFVQGDTTTAFVSSLAAFYQKIKVAHVEAGLRTYNAYSPWPEEMNRTLIGRVAKLHFPPTQESANNLLKEDIPKNEVHVVGNTVIDALLMVVKRFEQDRSLQDQMAAQFSMIDWDKRVILVTGHRRENHDGGLGRMCDALAILASRGDVEIIYPVHLNPNVQKQSEALRGVKGVHLIEPQDYLPFVYLLSKCYLVITDSGGVQEEAPSLGKPILVTRDTTERPEGITAGNAKLVGTDMQAIVTAATELLDNQEAYQAMSEAANPYGDGQSAMRIINVMKDMLSQAVTENV